MLLSYQQTSTRIELTKPTRLPLYKPLLKMPSSGSNSLSLSLSKPLGSLSCCCCSNLINGDVCSWSLDLHEVCLPLTQEDSGIALLVRSLSAAICWFVSRIWSYHWTAFLRVLWFRLRVISDCSPGIWYFHFFPPWFAWCFRLILRRISAWMSRTLIQLDVVWLELLVPFTMLVFGYAFRWRQLISEKVAVCFSAFRC